MDFIALGLSGAALLVSILSAYNAYRNRQASERSADAAESSAHASHLSAESGAEIARAERNRRYEELAPGLNVSYEGTLEKQGGVEYRGIVIGVEGHYLYSDVRATLLPSPRGTEEAATGLIGIEGTSEAGQEISLGPVRGGDELRMGLILRRREDGTVAGGRARILLEIQDENGWQWPQVKHVNVPGDPRVVSL